MEEKKTKVKKIKAPREKLKQITELILDENLKKAYLDIETDGNFIPTVVGIYVQDRGFKAFVRPNIKADAIFDFIDGVDVVVTYNGERFDLEVLSRHCGFTLPPKISSLDLMYLCWEMDLYGGLKKVEKELGIVRDSEIDGLNGLAAVRLWEEYEEGNKHSLSLLKLYNRNDVLNLVELENKLRKMLLRKMRGSTPQLDI